MASSYSNSLKIQLMANGEDSNTWGTITNTNWNLMEQAVTGVDTIVMANANYTLTNLNGVSDEARNMVLNIVGTNSGIYQIIIPANQTKFYIVTNNTTGGYAITIGTTGVGGSLISIPSGVTAQVYTDGTNTYSAQTGSAGNFTVNGTLTANGISDLGALTATTISGTTITASVNYVGPGTGLTGTATSLTIGGNAATATNATNATQITNSGGWSVTPSGSKLYFNYNGTNVASLDSSGNLITLANVTAYGTP